MNLRYFILPESATVNVQACTLPTFLAIRQWMVVCEDSADTLPLIFNYTVNWLQANSLETLVLASTLSPTEICKTSAFLFLQNSERFTELRDRFSIFYLDSYESFVHKFSKQWKRPVQCLLLHDPVQLTHKHPASKQRALLAAILALIANKVALSAIFGGKELLHGQPNVILLRQKLKPHGLRLLQVLHAGGDNIDSEKGALLTMTPRGLLTCHAVIVRVAKYMEVVEAAT